VADFRNAQIIPFPVRATARAPLDPGPSGAPAQMEAGLTRAFNGLNSAIITQRAAMNTWKAAIADLRTVTARLADSLRGYNDSLGHLDARVQILRAEAVRLEAWADGEPVRKGGAEADQTSRVTVRPGGTRS